jgi:hypothetical protein
MSVFDPARTIADAVMYEGFLLYPYTASARKNQLRWQFGVVVPRAAAAAGAGESCVQQTEILLEPEATPTVEVRVRFLHVITRQVEVCVEAGFEPVESLEVEQRQHLSFDDTLEREVDLHVRPIDTAQSMVAVTFEGRRDEEFLRDGAGNVCGRIVRQSWPLRGTLSVHCEPAAGASHAYKLRVRLENESDVVAAPNRRSVLRTAFVAAHTLLHVTDGRFLSALDPPSGAAQAAALLRNEGTWPVLVGDKSDPQRSPLVLSSPIILYDFPAVAAKSDVAGFDGTEIDELLKLSVLGLSEAERAEARATDPRAKAIVERAEAFDAQAQRQLHAGALTLDPVTQLDVPALDCLFVGGTKVARGSAVRLRPTRRADVMDSFLAGKVATVRAIHQDLEDQFYVAVTVDEDPASDLHDWYGRSFFFYPDEIEPL